MKKKLILFSLCLVLFASMLAACTNSGTTTPTEPPAAAPTDAPEATEPPAAEPTEEPAASNEPKILRFGTSSYTGVFNPIYYDEVYDGYVSDLIFDGLVINDPTGEYEPLLAEKWEVSEDKLTYTFTLKDAKFHDGTPVTTEDVAFTFMSLASPDYTGVRGYAVADIVGYEAYSTGETDVFEGIQIIDEKTISFTIAAPNVAKIQDFGYGILPKHIYDVGSHEKMFELNGKPVGCGRFMLEEYQPGQFIKTVAFEDYYNEEKKPSIDGVTLLVIPDDTQIDALLAGEVDIINPSASGDNYTMINDSDIANCITFVGNGYNFMAAKHNDPVTGDKLVRKGLMHGFDRAGFIENQWEGLAEPGLCGISPVSWAYPDVSTLDPYEYDPEKAAAYFDEAGWILNESDGLRYKDGKKMTIVLTVYDDVAWPMNLASVLKEQWGALGVDFSAEVFDFTTVADKATNHELQMFVMGWSMSIDPDPTGVYDSASAAVGGFNYAEFKSEYADELFKKGLAEYDQDKRAEIYQEWAQIDNDEQPRMYMAVRQEVWGFAKNITNIDKLGPYYNWVYLVSDLEME